MRTPIAKRRLLGIALVLALLASMTLVNASGLAVTQQEILVNGNFEAGFTFIPGCGNVGKGWGCFTNGGSVDYGFYDDQWKPVVADGSHSQLIEISTIDKAVSHPDRYAGIYQTVKVVKGATYQLQVKGLMREGFRSGYGAGSNDDPFRYRVQWGYTLDAITDWTKVTNWQELPWDKIDNRTSPTGMQSFSTSFVAPKDQITIFLRVWKKWATLYRELDVNLDAISLFGPAVKAPLPPKPPVTDGKPPIVIPPPPPPPPPPLVCGGKNYIVNGDFEGGFNGGVGKGWTAWNNGGNASYGFYDEMWTKVIKDGAHGQLIEINSYCRGASDGDRYAGIYQVVTGLTKGATYEFSLWGMLREEAAHPDEDAFRYRVQWGYAAADADPNQDDVTNWTELPWDKIYVRTAPGDMSYYNVQFKAPSDKVVIAIRAWKKWGTTQRELDVNLDAIKLVSCTPELRPPDGDDCIWHVVKPGDTVYGLAVKYHSTVALIVERNRLSNPNLIRPGQKLCIVDP